MTKKPTISIFNEQPHQIPPPPFLKRRNGSYQLPLEIFFVWSVRGYRRWYKDGHFIGGQLPKKQQYRMLISKYSMMEEKYRWSMLPTSIVYHHHFRYHNHHHQKNIYNQWYIQLCYRQEDQQDNHHDNQPGNQQVNHHDNHRHNQAGNPLVDHHDHRVNHRGNQQGNCLFLFLLLLPPFSHPFHSNDFLSHCVVSVPPTKIIPPIFKLP